MLSATFALFTAGLATMASAYTQPQGATPSGNPILKPNVNEPVSVGKPFEITWQPTSEGTVTLLLLRGPSTNVVPLYPIVENIPNTGSYSWTPSSSLEVDETGYGIQLIQDSNGVYQYSTQFGVSGSSDSTDSTSMPDVEYKHGSETNTTVPHYPTNGTCATVCSGYHNGTNVSTTSTYLPTNTVHSIYTKPTEHANSTLYTTVAATPAAQSPAVVAAAAAATTTPAPPPAQAFTGAASQVTASLFAGAVGALMVLMI